MNTSRSYPTICSPLGRPYVPLWAAALPVTVVVGSRSLNVLMSPATSGVLIHLKKQRGSFNDGMPSSV
jgi:hypothetical protein